MLGTHRSLSNYNGLAWDKWWSRRKWLGRKMPRVAQLVEPGGSKKDAERISFGEFRLKTEQRQNSIPGNYIRTICEVWTNRTIWECRMLDLATRVSSNRHRLERKQVQRSWGCICFWLCLLLLEFYVRVHRLTFEDMRTLFQDTNCNFPTASWSIIFLYFYVLVSVL